MAGSPPKEEERVRPSRIRSYDIGRMIQVEGVITKEEGPWVLPSMRVVECPIDKARATLIVDPWDLVFLRPLDRQRLLDRRAFEVLRDAAATLNRLRCRHPFSARKWRLMEEDKIEYYRLRLADLTSPNGPGELQGGGPLEVHLLGMKPPPVGTAVRLLRAEVAVNGMTQEMCLKAEAYERLEPAADAAVFSEFLIGWINSLPGRRTQRHRIRGRLFLFLLVHTIAAWWASEGPRLEAGNLHPRSFFLEVLAEPYRRLPLYNPHGYYSFEHLCRTIRGNLDLVAREMASVGLRFDMERSLGRVFFQVADPTLFQCLIRATNVSLSTLTSDTSDTSEKNRARQFSDTPSHHSEIVEVSEQFEVSEQSEQLLEPAEQSEQSSPKPRNCSETPGSPKSEQSGQSEQCVERHTFRRGGGP